MADVDVAYNEDQAPLEALLRAIDRPGDYCTQGRLFVPMPRVEVEGAGPLSFPITAQQAHALTAAAAPAPYGRGEQTLVDPSVRACRQIDAARLRVAGGAWRDTLEQIVVRAATGLGCPPERTCAHLYKLLIYERGGFFAAHRDTEKEDGMVATLVLSLPVAGAGGELIIRHQQRQTVVDLRAEEPSEIAFAAFYADCVHEVRQVTAGHRIVLVYNLTLQGNGPSLPTAPDFGSQEQQISALLADWEAASATGDKLVWLLEHDYSEAGLSFDALKNTDAAVAGVLARAAQRAQHALFAAVLRIEEYGYADESGGFPDWDDDDDDWEMDEVFSSAQTLDGWVAPDGTRPGYSELPLLPGELLPDAALEGAQPDDQQATVTGNEGVELSRSYRRAALVLWPAARTVATLARGGIEGAVTYVAEELELTEPEARPGGRLLGMAAQLIDAWPAPGRGGARKACRAALRLLRRLGDDATTRRFLREVATPHYESGANDELLATAASADPATLDAWLPEFVATNVPRQPEAALDLLWRLCGREQSPADGAAPRRSSLEAAARAASAAFPAAVASAAAAEPAARRGKARPLGARAIRSLLLVTWRFGLAAEAEAAARLLVERPAAATPQRALPEALAETAEVCGIAGGAAAPAGFAALWRHAASSLLAHSAQPPEEPADWVIATRIPCTCPHCRHLQAFCDDPTATTLRLPLRKELRRHVHGVIDGLGLDIRHQTERKGSPYTLVCTKTRGAWQRRCAQYAEDIAHLRLLAAAAPSIGAAADACAGDLQQVQAAIARNAAAAPAP